MVNGPKFRKLFDWTSSKLMNIKHGINSQPETSEFSSNLSIYWKIVKLLCDKEKNAQFDYWNEANQTKWAFGI